jgi:hypothetical protein
VLHDKEIGQARHRREAPCRGIRPAHLVADFGWARTTRETTLCVCLTRLVGGIRDVQIRPKI